jgi:hypothetical protein
MPLVDIVDIPATVMSGILAGSALGAGLSQMAGASLPAEVWIAQHRPEDKLLRKVLPPFMIAAIVLLVVTTGLARGPARWLYLAATLAAMADFWITGARMAPISRKIAAWTQPAPDWVRERAKWQKLHSARGAVTVLGFVASAGGLAMA